MKSADEVEAMLSRFENSVSDDMTEAEEAVQDTLLWVLGQRTDHDLAAYFEEA